jgi:hypothetical protein
MELHNGGNSELCRDKDSPSVVGVIAVATAPFLNPSNGAS